MRIGPPQPDIEEVPFAETPPIAFHVRAEIQFGRSAAHRAIGLLALIHLKLSLLRDHRRSSRLRTEMSSHGAKMSTRAHHQTRPQVAIDNPTSPIALDAREPNTLVQSRPAAPQQILIEFAAPNPVTNRPSVIRIDRRTTPNRPRPETGDRLQRPTHPICHRVDLRAPSEPAE